MAPPSLAVYVHFPWCVQRCPYCDFATEAAPVASVPHDEYAAAVCAELALRAPSVAPERGVAAGPVTLFFGGGTPGLWRADALGRVVAAVRARFGVLDEVTVECNPTALDEAHARALQAQGVDRLSVGVQSLRDPLLRYLGRAHDAAEALAAVRAAARVPGLRVSADLMYGLAEQRDDELLDDARALLDAGVEHLSAYALTIEPQTRFGELARKGRLPKLPDERVAEQFEALGAALAARGFARYEVSNYARAGAEARHNQRYWRGAYYLGLGAGAVGCVPAEGNAATRYRDVHDAAGYLAALGRGALPPDETETLDAATRVREALMLGLRTSEGLDVARVREHTGLDPLEGRERAVRRAVQRGNLEVTRERWSVPPARWLLADDIVAALF